MPRDTKPTMKELAYIGDVAKNAPCPFCRNETWTYLKNKDGSPWKGSLEIERENVSMTVPSIPLICDKCGFVRFHDLAMIRVNLREESKDG